MADGSKPGTADVRQNFFYKTDTKVRQSVPRFVAYQSFDTFGKIGLSQGNLSQNFIRAPR
jgi:hypothetical protein